jgi:hypothetical protein
MMNRELIVDAFDAFLVCSGGDLSPFVAPSIFRRFEGLGKGWQAPWKHNLHAVLLQPNVLCVKLPS